MFEVNVFLSIILVLFMAINMTLKSPNWFFVNIFNLMNSVGAMFYVFGGAFYRPPSDNALAVELSTFIIVNAAYAFYANISRFYNSTCSNIACKWVSKKANFYLALFLLPPLIYFLIFVKAFPIYQAVCGNFVGEFSRPDVTGYLPKFYSFSVFVVSFSIPYFINLFKKAKSRARYVYFVILVFCAMLIGDKSTILVIIFFIFLYNTSDCGVNFNFKRGFLFMMLFVLIYLGSKYIYWGTLPNVAKLAESLFRRVFVINASVYGNFIDYFVLQGGQIPSGFKHIKEFMFYYVYGYTPGGAPVNYLGSILYYLGFGIPQAFIVFFATVYLLQFKGFLLKRNITHFKEAFLFLHFYGDIVLSNAYIRDYVIRALAPMIIFMILDRVKFR